MRSTTTSRGIGGVVVLACVALLAQLAVTHAYNDLPSYPRTISAAMDKLHEHVPKNRKLSVHVVGSSIDVEALVKWDCDKVDILLVGVDMEKHEPDQPCVKSHTGMYSISATGGKKPDLIWVVNSDLYACPWRRSLWDMIASRVPVLATYYDGYEGEIVARWFKERHDHFSPESIAECDALTVDIHDPDHAVNHEKHTSVDSTKHAANVIWSVEPNPHKTGERNAFWMAFKGVDPKDEL